MKKGFINILELIFTMITLFIAFQVLFPGFSYGNRWNNALLLLTSRDIILTLDRVGSLYDCSFNATRFSDFLNKVIPIEKTNLIGWSETDGTIKSNLTIACNCTKDQRDLLYNWTTGLTINGRAIKVYVVDTKLDDINPFSDVLFVWGYRDLTPYRNSLLGYINGERGIVEMMSFSANPEPVQQEIFNITGGGSWGSPGNDGIVKPATANNVTYQAYKIYVNGLKGQSPITPEFCKKLSGVKIIPVNSDVSRVLMQGNDTTNRDFCVIFNDKKIAKVAWMADFTSVAYNVNHTKLLTSALLSVSNKRSLGILSTNMKIGYMTSYINVNNIDMFEIYRFNVVLGHPY